jgi:RNA polymerase sigma factor (sigma-70 family)
VTGDSIERERLSADLQQTGDGNRAAFRRVYRATTAKLLGLCIRVVGDRLIAEDVLQEVYLIVWRQAGQFDPARASPITWLAMIARNRAIDWKRARDRRGDRFGAMMPPFIADESVPVDQRLASEEMERAAIACLDQLSADQRQAIRDAFIEGLTYVKIAEQGHLPLGTIKSRIRRGLLELKKCLSDE